MNKNLIQRLLDQSCYDEQDQRELEDWCNVEKFAELIVGECVDIISPYAVRMENFDGGHPITDLKEHFGVEE